MVKFLVMQIRLGKITLDQVPEKYKEKVKKLTEVINNEQNNDLP